MRKLVLAVLATALIAPSLSAQVRVKGYTRKDGTYVAPSYRSRPNSTLLNNYSTKGNTNPYTGKAGTKDPYSTPTYRSPYSTPSTTPCYYACGE